MQSFDDQTTKPTLLPGAQAPDVALQSTDGRPIALAQFWQRQPTLLFFLRHFGCVFCRKQLVELRARHADIAAQGAEVVVITPVDAIGADIFARRMGLPFPLLADSSRAAFHAYGLFETPLMELAKPQVVGRTMGEWARGNIPAVNPLMTSFTQLGGLFIVDTDGAVHLSHVASPVYSYPSIEACLEVLAALRAPRSSTIGLSTEAPPRAA